MLDKRNYALVDVIKRSQTNSDISFSEDFRSIQDQSSVNNDHTLSFNIMDRYSAAGEKSIITYNGTKSLKSQSIHSNLQKKLDSYSSSSNVLQSEPDAVLRIIDDPLTQNELEKQQREEMNNQSILTDFKSRDSNFEQNNLKTTQQQSEFQSQQNKFIQKMTKDYTESNEFIGTQPIFTNIPTLRVINKISTKESFNKFDFSYQKRQDQEKRRTRIISNSTEQQKLKEFQIVQKLQFWKKMDLDQSQLETIKKNTDELGRITDINNIMIQNSRSNFLSFRDEEKAFFKQLDQIKFLRQSPFDNIQNQESLNFSNIKKLNINDSYAQINEGMYSIRESHAMDQLKRLKRNQFKFLPRVNQRDIQTPLKLGLYNQKSRIIPISISETEIKNQSSQQKQKVYYNKWYMPVSQWKVEKKDEFEEKTEFYQLIQKQPSILINKLHEKAIDEKNQGWEEQQQLDVDLCANKAIRRIQRYFYLINFLYLVEYLRSMTEQKMRIPHWFKDVPTALDGQDRFFMRLGQLVMN